MTSKTFELERKYICIIIYCKFSRFMFINRKNLLKLSKNPRFDNCISFIYFFLYIDINTQITSLISRAIFSQIPRKRTKVYHGTEILYENDNCLQQFLHVCRVKLYKRTKFNQFPEKKYPRLQAFRLRLLIRNDETFEIIPLRESPVGVNIKRIRWIFYFQSLFHLHNFVLIFRADSIIRRRISRRKITDTHIDFNHKVGILF